MGGFGIGVLINAVLEQGIATSMPNGDRSSKSHIDAQLMVDKIKWTVTFKQGPTQTM